MKKLFLTLSLLASLFLGSASASGWYSTLQGTASDVQQSAPQDKQMIQWSSTDRRWDLVYPNQMGLGTYYLSLDQSIPQTFSGTGFTGNGLLKITSGTLGVDSTVYVSSLTTSTPTNLTGFIKGNGSVLSADNSTYLLNTGATLGATSQAQGFTAPTTSRASINLNPSSTVNPSAPNSGDMWWNGTNLYFYNGSSNKDLLAGGGGSISTLSTLTDVTLTNLADGQLLKYVLADLKWENFTPNYLTSVTAHNLLSTTHGDTTADSVVRGDIITGQGATPKWTRLAFPATPTGKVLQATATDVGWSTNPLTIGVNASVSGTNTGDQTLSGLGGQPALNGTGFVKAAGTTISYDASTYLTSLSGAVLTTGNQSVAGIKTFSDATEASNATTGGTVVSGGLAVAKRVYATDMTVTNKITGSISGNADGSSGSCTGNAATVTTNANLTGAVTSVGNATTLVGGVKNDGTVNPTNLLSNGGFANWSAGTSSAPDGWTTYLAGGSIARESSTVKYGTYSVKLTANNNVDDSSVYYIINTNLGYWKGRTITFSAWVWCDTANRALLRIDDGIAANSSYHTGNSTWQLLSVTKTIDSGATCINIYGYIMKGSVISAYIDGAMCVEGESAFAFSDKPAIDPGIAVGGTGAAGAGKQYVVIRIGGVNYKVLHDGTI